MIIQDDRKEQTPEGSVRVRIRCKDSDSGIRIFQPGPDHIFKRRSVWDSFYLLKTEKHGRCEIGLQQGGRVGT